MRVSDNSTRGVHRAGFPLARYYDAKRRPWLVEDADRGVAHPNDGGAGLTGFFDILVDGAEYAGLYGPFETPDLGTPLVVAYRSVVIYGQDNILHPDGTRTEVVGEDAVLEDDDMWGLFPDGVFDLQMNDQRYVGLTSPFFVPDIGADFMWVYPSDVILTTDLLLSLDGSSSEAPDDSDVPGDTDIWSVKYA